MPYGDSARSFNDSEKIALLMRGGTFPMSYVYPREMRATRDLVRRRMFLVRRRSELWAHVQLLNQQYNYDPFEKVLQYASNRDVLDRFVEDSASLNVEADLQKVGHYDLFLKQLEVNFLRHAKSPFVAFSHGSFQSRLPRHKQGRWGAVEMLSSPVAFSLSTYCV